jgi:hypothetical protein
MHAVEGTGTTGNAVDLGSLAQFTSAASYTCYGSDNAHATAEVTFTYTSGSSFTPTSPAGLTDGVRFICLGN